LARLSSFDDVAWIAGGSGEAGTTASAAGVDMFVGVVAGIEVTTTAPPTLVKIK
jgi:hypothetical protein